MAYPSFAGSSNSANGVTAKPAGTASGTFLFASVLAVSQDSTVVSAPAGWEVVDSRLGDYYGYPATGALYFKVAGASEPTTYTWSVANPFGVSVFIVGVNGADGFATSNNYQTSGTGIIFSSVTPAISQSLILLMGYQSDAVESQSWASTVPAGTTKVTGSEVGRGVAYFQHPTATATGTKTVNFAGETPITEFSPAFSWTVAVQPPDVADTTAPTITSSGFGSVNENTAFSRTLTANEAVTWTKTGGADQALFTLSGNTLTMTAKNYESPADANGDNLYLVIIRATDAAGNWTEQTIQLAVNDVGGEDTTAPTITSSATHSVAENSPYSTTATANETVTWSKSGTDSALVTLNSSTGVWSIAAQDYETKPTVSFILTATDAASNATNQSVTVNITDVTEAEPPAVVTTARPFKLSGRFRGGDSAWWSPNTALILEKGFFQSADPVDPPVGVNFTRCYAFII